MSKDYIALSTSEGSHIATIRIRPEFAETKEAMRAALVGHYDSDVTLPSNMQIAKFDFNGRIEFDARILDDDYSETITIEQSWLY